MIYIKTNIGNHLNDLGRINESPSVEKVFSKAVLMDSSVFNAKKPSLILYTKEKYFNLCE